MADDVQIRKVNDHELSISLPPNAKITKDTITPEELYESLGTHLHQTQTDSAAPCIIDYA